MSSADFTVYTPGIGTLTWSHLLWGEFSAFSAANAVHNFFQFLFHQVPITAGWTEAVWYERFLPNTYTHQLTSVIFGNWLIFHVLPLVWEVVRRTNRLGTRLCGTWMSTWRRHFWCTHQCSLQLSNQCSLPSTLDSLGSNKEKQTVLQDKHAVMDN